MKRLTIGATLYRDEDREYLPKNYYRAIGLMGGVALPLPASTPPDRAGEICDGLDGMLFTGGDDVTPSLYGQEAEPETEGMDIHRDELERALLMTCLERGIPVMGICRGCQIINVALGGTLVQHIPRRFGQTHWMKKGQEIDFLHYVRVLQDTELFRTLGGDVFVNSYHHQCVDRLADGLRATAFAPEGFVEAFEKIDRDTWLLAVQWHPEVTAYIDTASRKLFEAFGEAARRYSLSSRQRSSAAVTLSQGNP